MTESIVDVEPSASALRGSAPGRTARRLLLATRPKFFTASLLPVLIGTGWGARMAGELDLLAFTLAVAATICVHAGANVLNDVYDDLGGSDAVNDARIHPYTGGSRFIQNAIMSRGEMARWGSTLLAAGVLFGALLTLHAGAGVIGLGLAGIALGVLYSLPPVQLCARGLGEAAVAIGFGILPLCGAAWLQGGPIDAAVLLLSLPPSLWTAAILLINEVPDTAADASVGKRTLAVRLGDAHSARLYLALHAGAVLAVLGLAASGALIAWVSVLPLLLLVPAALAARSIAAPHAALSRRRGIELTLAVHLLGGLWLAGFAWFAHI